MKSSRKIDKIKTVDMLTKAIHRSMLATRYDQLFRRGRDQFCLVLAVLSYTGAAMLTTIKPPQTRPAWEREVDLLRQSVDYLRTWKEHATPTKQEIEFTVAWMTAKPYASPYALYMSRFFCRSYYEVDETDNAAIDICSTLVQNFSMHDQKDVVAQFKASLIAYGFDFEEMKFIGLS